MTWDAYNRRKEVLNEVHAIADRHRGDVNPTEIPAEVDCAHRPVTSEVNLLHDAMKV